MIILGTPIKLKDGSWGAKVACSVALGNEIKVTTRAGKSWTSIVSRIVWKNDEVAIVATGTARREIGGGAWKRIHGRGTLTGCSCGSVEEFTKASDCWLCKHDAD